MSAAIKALAFRKYDKRPEETKFGWVIFSGHVNDYHFWTYKTDLKLKVLEKLPENKRREETPDAIVKMLDALSGEALRLATSIPVEELLEIDLSGIEKLKEKIRTWIFPVIKDEVKTLWREGQRESGGVLSRQYGEPMNMLR